MVDYKLKKDVVINGMEFKANKIINIPQYKIDEFERENDSPIETTNDGGLSKKSKKKKVKQHENQS